MRKSTLQSEGPGSQVTTYRRELDGMGELVDLAKLIDSAPPEVRNDCSSFTGDYNFTGTRSLKEAIALCEYGWPEGRKHLAEAVGKISVDDLIGDVMLPQPMFDVCGDEVDIGRTVAGEPEDMVTYSFPFRPMGKIIELVVNCGQPGRVSTEAIIRRGAAVIAAVQAMEESGYSVGITMANRTGSISGDTYVELFVPVVSPGSLLDIDAAAFALAHPSFLRRLIFAAKENEEQGLRRTMSFYRSMGYYGKSVAIASLPEVNHHQVIIEKDDGLQGGTAAARKIVDRMIARALAYIET